jgi:hypothetical protein
MQWQFLCARNAVTRDFSGWFPCHITSFVSGWFPPHITGFIARRVITGRFSDYRLLLEFFQKLR